MSTAQLSLVEDTLNAFLITGRALPTTRDGFVLLFADHVDAETLLSFFQQNRVKWVMGEGLGESYEVYNMAMNKSAAVYMSL